MLDKRFLVCTTIAVAACVTVWHLIDRPQLPALSDSDAVNNHPGTPYTLLTANTSYTYPFYTLPSDDYHRLINLTNFTFNIFNRACNSSVLLLVLIHTSPLNFSKRKAIRETWGQPRYNCYHFQ